MLFVKIVIRSNYKILIIDNFIDIAGFRETCRLQTFFKKVNSNNFERLITFSSIPKIRTW